MEILGISGGVRNGSNDGMCIETLVGAKEMGVEVELVQLQNLHIERCTSCTACVRSMLGSRGGKCVLKDDFNWLLDRMLDTDGIVFSTPIFERGATGLFHMTIDRFGPRMDRGDNVIGIRTAEEIGGIAPDLYILKDKVVSFTSVDGSDWVTRAQYDADMLALTPVWEVIDNEVFPWALSILVEDERVARAHQISRNITEAAKNVEHAQYQDDAGVYLHCHGRNFHLQDDRAIYCLYDLEDEIHNESGGYSFTFPVGQLEHTHDTLSGKSTHGSDIKENTGKKAANMQTEKYKARQAAYRAFIAATMPEKGRGGGFGMSVEFHPMRSVTCVDVCRKEYRRCPQRWLYGHHIQDSISNFSPYVTKYAFYNALPVPPEGKRFDTRRMQMTERCWLINEMEPEVHSKAIAEYMPMDVLRWQGCVPDTDETPHGGLDNGIGRSVGGDNGCPLFVFAHVPISWEEDFKGKGRMVCDGPNYHWQFVIQYPDGVSEEKSERWFHEEIAPYFQARPEVSRFLFDRVYHGVVGCTFHRLVGLWFNSPEEWYQAAVEGAKALSKPVWAQQKRLPFLKSSFNIVDMFLTGIPTSDNLTQFRDYITMC